MEDRNLTKLAIAFDEAKIAYLACDPASPAADTAMAVVFQQKMGRIILEMSIILKFDMAEVHSAIDFAASDIVRQIKCRGYYTEADLIEIRSKL